MEVGAYVYCVGQTTGSSALCTDRGRLEKSTTRARAPVGARLQAYDRLSSSHLLIAELSHVAFRRSSANHRSIEPVPLTLNARTPRITNPV